MKSFKVFKLNIFKKIMGNINSIPQMNINNSIKHDNKYDICLVCWERIKPKNIVSCSRCNIQIHDFCYQNYNKINKYNYYICPHCQRVGTFEKELWKRECIFENKHRNISKF
jgi:hypothetical protein